MQPAKPTNNGQQTLLVSCSCNKKNTNRPNNISDMTFCWPIFCLMKADAYGFRRSMTCLLRRGFFFCTALCFVLFSPLGARRTLCISELLIRRVRSACETTLDGSRKSCLRSEGFVVVP